MERHQITFDDLVGLHRLDHVEIGTAPVTDARPMFQLITDAGRFTFPTSLMGRLRDQLGPIESSGEWEPGVTMPSGLGLLVMCRVVPNAEKQARRMYCVDEATGLVVLEFGFVDRTYDDPNLPRWRVGVFRWEKGVGWESPYLVEPETPGVEIKRRWEFSPKRVGAGRPKGNY